MRTQITHLHTHTVFPAPRDHLDVPVTLSRFPLWSPEPQVPAAGSPWRRGFENHRPKTDHTYRSSLFHVFLRVLRTPDTPHTYLYPLSLSSWLKRLPRNSSCTLALRLFESPFSESWCTEVWNPASDFPGLTLFRFNVITVIRQSKVRTPRTRTPETETSSAPKVARFFPVLCFSSLYSPLRQSRPGRYWKNAFRSSRNTQHTQKNGERGSFVCVIGFRPMVFEPAPPG